MRKLVKQKVHILLPRIAIVVLLCLSGSRALAQTEEYSVKAAFLEKFTRFIEWPGEEEADSTQPFVVGVIGKNPFGNHLEEIFNARKVKHRPAQVRYFESVQSLEDCNILYVSRSMKISLSKILEKTRGHPVLLVGDTTGFAAQGVHINLYLSGKSVRFEANPQAFRQSGLKVSYLLLNLARIVPNGEEQK